MEHLELLSRVADDELVASNQVYKQKSSICEE